jgi:predicted enzyme related to lactoylglutathione lyase
MYLTEIGNNFDREVHLGVFHRPIASDNGRVASPAFGTDGGVEYIELSAGGRPGGGVMAMPSQVPSEVPAHWTPYFQVTDCDATAAKATSAGGKTIVPPTDIPKVGRFAMIEDPQGAMFAIFKPLAAT